MTEDNPDDGTTEKLYRCPYCSTTYSDERFARVHVTRADDGDHANRNGVMPEEQIELVDENSNVVETRSRHPEDIDLTTVTVDDFPDELTKKRRHALVVATHHPTEDTRQRLTEMTEQRLSNSEYDVEPPSARTVGQALDDFYHPHLGKGADIESLAELAETQQAIVIANLAHPNASIGRITDLVGCSETYSRQVTTNFRELLDRLESEIADGKPLRAIIEEQLPNADITTLVDNNLITELDGIDIEALRPVNADEGAASESEPNSSPATDNDDIPTQIEAEYDADRWGSPVAQSTGLQASPDSPFDSSDATDTSPPENEDGDNSSEFKPIPIADKPTAETQDGTKRTETKNSADRPGIAPHEVKNLKKKMGFLREIMETTEMEGAELIVSVASQVERHCDQLLQSHS